MDHSAEENPIAANVIQPQSLGKAKIDLQEDVARCDTFIKVVAFIPASQA
jgi:hypothetical protein